ncbi:hypothetical protein D3C71_1031690 [compost metagenome]
MTLNSSKFGVPRKPRSMTPAGISGSIASLRNWISSVAATGMTPSAIEVSSIAQSIAARRGISAAAAKRVVKTVAAAPRNKCRRRKIVEMPVIQPLPGEAQLSHDGTAVAIVASK